MSDKKPTPRTGFYKNDEVYFDHPSGPRSGRILAYGKHGCTIDCEGKRHKVKWDRVSGHKKRSELSYNVVDHGEDGMIVEDSSGRRRFIGVPMQNAPERIIIRDGKVKDARPGNAPVKKAPDVQEKPAPEPEEMKKSDESLRKFDYCPKILLWSGRF